MPVSSHPSSLGSSSQGLYDNCPMEGETATSNRFHESTSEGTAFYINSIGIRWIFMKVKAGPLKPTQFPYIFHHLHAPSYFTTMCLGLEDLISPYPIVAILSSFLWQEDLISLALVSKASYATLRGNDKVYWKLLNKKARRGCKFEETGQYDHAPDTPTPLNFLTSGTLNWFEEDSELEGLDLEEPEEYGVCVTCRDQICLVSLWFCIPGGGLRVTYYHVCMVC